MNFLHADGGVVFSRESRLHFVTNCEQTVVRTTANSCNNVIIPRAYYVGDGTNNSFVSIEQERPFENYLWEFSYAEESLKCFLFVLWLLWKGDVFWVRIKRSWNFNITHRIAPVLIFTVHRYIKMRVFKLR